MKYRVSGKVNCWVSIVIDAPSKEEALDVAYSEFGGVSGYCGNGGTGKLIGVSGSNEYIEGDEVEFTDVEEAPED